MHQEITASREEEFLFTFYKGKRDCRMTISIEEEVPFKGLISTTPDFQIIEHIFSKRFCNFSLIGKIYVKKIYVKLRIEKPATFHINFKFTLSKPVMMKEDNWDYGIPELEEKNHKATFHTKIAKQLRDIDIFGGLSRYKSRKNRMMKSTHIIKYNKRCISSYNLNKRITSAKNFRVTDMRIVSAKKKKRRNTNLRKIYFENKFYRKDLKKLGMMLENIIHNSLKRQRKWIQVFRFFAVLEAMVDVFADRVHEIEKMEENTRKMTMVKEVFTCPEILRM